MSEERDQHGERGDDACGHQLRGPLLVVADEGADADRDRLGRVLRERGDEQQLVPREQERVDERRHQPGAAFGSTIFTNAPNGVQPSTIAASSSSRGIARKNERMKKIATGVKNAV